MINISDKQKDIEAELDERPLTQEVTDFIREKLSPRSMLLAVLDSKEGSFATCGGNRDDAIAKMQMSSMLKAVAESLDQQILLAIENDPELKQRVLDQLGKARIESADA